MRRARWMLWTPGSAARFRAALRADADQTPGGYRYVRADVRSLIAAFGEGPAPEGKRLPQDRQGGDRGGDRCGGRPSASLLEDLIAALRDDDADELRRLAALSVDQFGGIGSTSQDSERALLYRVLRGLDLALILQRALRESGALETNPRSSDALVPAEIAARVEEFRRLLGKGGAPPPRPAVRTGRGGNPAFRRRPRGYADPGRKPIRPRRSAARPPPARTQARRARMRRNRVTRRGRLDVRRTIRRSLSTGGIPLEPRWRRPRTTRPELVVLCDVSGSVPSSPDSRSPL